MRDETGNCIAALQRSLPFCSSALHAETEACRAGLALAIQQGWDNFILESDCNTLTTALSSLEDDLSEVGQIIGDCKESLKGRSIDIHHIFREANSVAHRLAHLASFSSISVTWLDETPSIIEDVLYADWCNSTRGLAPCPPRCTSFC